MKGFKLWAILAVVWIAMLVSLEVIKRQFGYDTDFFAGYFSAVLITYGQRQSKVDEVEQTLKDARDLYFELKAKKGHNLK